MNVLVWILIGWWVYMGVVSASFYTFRYILDEQKPNIGIMLLLVLLGAASYALAVIAMLDSILEALKIIEDPKKRKVMDKLKLHAVKEELTK